jgi:RHS repeat-associated protein
MRLRAFIFLALLCAAVPAVAWHVQYYHPDNLGSTAIQSDKSGNLIQSFTYSAFGQSRYTLDANLFKPSRRYTGQVLDEGTGLYYYNFRYYDPNLGRFTQPDDIIPDLANPQSYNRYSYCVNNPLRYTDPNGHAPSDWANAMQPGIDSYYDGYVSNPSHTSTLGLFAAYMGQSVAGGYNDMLRFGTGMEQGGVDGICADLGRGSGIILTVTGPVKATATKLAPPKPAAPKVVPEAASTSATTPSTKPVNNVPLSPEQQAKLNAFKKDLPKANTGTSVDKVGDQVLFTSEVPGKVPGSKAVYQKTVDDAGTTTSMVKTTFDPKGNVVHIKDKLPPPPPPKTN